MMAMRGQRFEVNLDSDGESAFDSGQSSRSSFVRDIQEREHNDSTPPAAPRFKTSSTGFPEPRRRARLSKFRQQRSYETSIATPSLSPLPSQTSKDAQLPQSRKEFSDAEIRSIDEENKQRLDDMSSEEIEQERKELMSKLSGSLIERLLKRGNIEEEKDDIDAPLATDAAEEPLSTESENPPQTSNGPKKVTFSDPKPSAQPVPKPTENPSSPLHDPDAAPSAPPPLHAASTPSLPLPSLPNIHFPTPPLPTLDPSSPTFLNDLHKKYFPTLPSDPSKLAWMAPTSSEYSPQYDPQTSSLAPSDLRFDFSGNLLPPRLSHQLPATLGLHHHGNAPEAAGYTIPELAILARSSVAAQRGMAFQTLGHVLYKLGTGVFGDDGWDSEKGEENVQIDEDDEGALLCRGLWTCVRQERVLETLLDEAGRGEGRGHRSARALAVEAVWLWRKGGGRGEDGGGGGEMRGEDGGGRESVG